jgi:hypothetical protein
VGVALAATVATTVITVETLVEMPVETPVATEAAAAETGATEVATCQEERLRAEVVEKGQTKMGKTKRLHLGLRWTDTKARTATASLLG